MILTHHTGEPHALLGPQVAATFLSQRLSMPSMVIGIQRNFSKEKLFDFLKESYSGKERVVAFSHLCARKDLLELAQELKNQGFFTILAGPQARTDYFGEPETDLYPHRFPGLRESIDFVFQGPIDYFKLEGLPGSGRVLDFPWSRDIFLDVDWSNLYTFSDGINKPEIKIGQVLNAVGCPYARTAGNILLPPPASLRESGIPEIAVRSEGCIFCDVARDKGYHGAVSKEALLAQISNLPVVDGKKIPFELIDEYPIQTLATLLDDAPKHRIRLSQINLVCRADEINRQARALAEVLSSARSQDIRILFASIGFESFSDRLLQYFSKGITVAENIKCIETLRRLKDLFRDHLFYRRDEGAHHGFIRPTPWDDGETLREMDGNIFLHRLFDDVLPEQSTPLIIHHASFLGDWLRRIEATSRIAFPRDGTWIEWWRPFPR